jgi:hypothetical protein
MELNARPAGWHGQESDDDPAMSFNKRKMESGRVAVRY